MRGQECRYANGGQAIGTRAPRQKVLGGIGRRRLVVVPGGGNDWPHTRRMRSGDWYPVDAVVLLELMGRVTRADT